MDDRKLEVFLAVVQTGSFSKASQISNCTQSAVTQMMNSFEAELGCKVLDRSHAGVKLTDAGEDLLPTIIEASNALSRLSRRASEQAHAVSEGTPAPLRIGSFASIADTWLPEALLEFRKQHKNLAFDIRIGSDILSNWLLRGEVDVALGDAERLRGFRWYALMDDVYCAVLEDKDYKEGLEYVTIEDLVKRPLILAPFDVWGRRMDALLPHADIVHCDDNQTLLTMVSKGFGTTIMPRMCLSGLPENTHVVALRPRTVRTVGVGVPNTPRKEANDLVDFLLPYCKENAEEIAERTYK
ncbi:MAG: LysR family transcriptional regulator [Eggerthellaceae bacterium]|jgi:DNA-binding transcriptional LysR family regulator